MKSFIGSIIAIIALIINSFSTPCFAQQTTAVTSATTSQMYSLTVVIYNVNNRTGKLYVGLADSSTSFKGESKQSKVIDVTPSGEMNVTFDGLASGQYAVRFFQDLNNNQKMDFSGQMPSEPFGISNVTMLMGPPNFDEASFELKENQTIRIRTIEM